jgi:pyridoxine/pyridoxamine 5'-phosphate oxidase
MAPTKSKTFDCLAFKDLAQARIRDAIRDMSHQEQQEYFRARAASGPLGAWWTSVGPRSDGPVDGARAGPETA